MYVSSFSDLLYVLAQQLCKSPRLPKLWKEVAFTTPGDLQGTIPGLPPVITVLLKATSDWKLGGGIVGDGNVYVEKV